MDRFPTLADALRAVLDDLPAGLVLVAGGDDQGEAMMPLASLELVQALAAAGQPAVDVATLCDLPSFEAAVSSLRAVATGRSVVLYQPGKPAPALLQALRGKLSGLIAATRSALVWTLRLPDRRVIEAAPRAFDHAPSGAPRHRGRGRLPSIPTTLTTMEGVRL